MSLRTVLLFVVFNYVACATAQAQEVPQPEKAAQEHKILKRFQGDWKVVSEAVAAPNTPATTVEGKMSSKMLGDLWVINEMSSELGETTMRGVQTIGYDPDKKRYIGTWVDSMTNHMWHYVGTLDESGTILTLEADGPGFSGGGSTAKYRDIYEFKADDHIVATSKVQDADGNWITFMTGDCRKQK